MKEDKKLIERCGKLYLNQLVCEILEDLLDEKDFTKMSELEMTVFINNELVQRIAPTVEKVIQNIATRIKVEL